MTILLSALLLLAQTGKRPSPDQEIFVRTDSTVSVERLAAIVRPMGKIESKERGSRTFLIQLNPGVEDDKAKERLKKIPGIHPLTPKEEPVDMTSVRSLARKIAHLTPDDEEKENKEKGKHKKDEVDYLKAYHYFISQRAFPNDRVNWKAYDVAKAQAALMQPTAIGWNGVGVRPLTTQTWQFIGPTNLRVPYQQYYGVSPVIGRINAVAYDPNNSQIIYAGAAQGGLWKSTDGGVTWSWLSTTWTQLAINAIAIDPTNTDNIYVARGDYHGMIGGSYGVMKSTDGGTTWSEVAEATIGKIGVAGMMMDPTNSQTLIIGTGDLDNYGHLYRSTNGGSTWAQVGPSGNDYLWSAITSSVVSGGKIRFYAVAAGFAASNNNTSRVYKSDDHGATWQLLPSPVAALGISQDDFHWAYAVAASPTNPNNVYVLDSENQAFYTSTNQGATWTNQSANLPAGNDISANYNFSQSFYDYHLECGTRVLNAVNTDVLYLGEIDITESLDGGNSWISVGGPSYEASGAITHNDQHSLAICPTNPNQALFSNDGGIYSLVYNPTTETNAVTPLNKNLGISMFYKIAPHPTNANYILGGTQDNASPLCIGDLSTWYNVGGGDGGGSVINPTTPQIQYTSAEGLEIFETSDGWNSTDAFEPSTSASDNLTYEFVTPMTLSPSNPNLMYVGTNYLYQYNQLTHTWANQVGGKDLTNETNPTQGELQAIAVAATDGTRIYTGSNDGALYMSTNQGGTWRNLGFKTTAAITSISVSPTNENDILVGISGAGNGNPHLFRCTNTSASTPAFVSVSGSGTTGLQDVSLNAICRDLDNPATTWWVAMDIGVFQTTNSGATWTNAGASNGLPNVIVDDLVAVPGTRYLYAGTYGMGIWRLNLPVAAQVPALTGFTLSPAAVAAGGTSTGTLTLSLAAPAGGFNVTLKSSNATLVQVPASVVIPEGATTATFTVTTNSSATAAGTAVVTATGGAVQMTQDLTVSIPKLSAFTLSPTTVTEGGVSTGTVTLLVPASGAGTTVTLKSSNVKVAQVPASILVPAGATTATFTVTTGTGLTANSLAIVTASAGGVSKAQDLTVDIPKLATFTLAPLTLGAGATANGVVTLTLPAPATGTVVTLKSSNPTLATVPATVIVPAGAAATTFTVTANPTVATSGTTVISASAGGIAKTQVLKVSAPTLSTFTLSPTSLIGGAAATGTVTLNVPAGPSGATITLKATGLYASVPGTLLIPAGTTSGTFTVSTSGVSVATTSTISAKFGLVTKSVTLAIKPQTVQSLVLNPTTVIGGSQTTVTGTVTLTGPAPNAGATVTLTSSRPAAASVPLSVKIPGGGVVGTFTVNHLVVSATAPVTIKATFGGASQSAILTVTPLQVTSFTLTPSSVVGGTPVTGTITLNAAPGAKAVTVHVTSNSTYAVAPVVTVPIGSASSTFTVTTKPIAKTTMATLTATLGTSSQKAAVTLLPPTLLSLTISPSTVQGSALTIVTGALTISSPAPAAFSVTLKSSTPAATVPATVTIPAGKQTATFRVTHKKVTTTTTATITATQSTTTQTALLTITP